MSDEQKDAAAADESSDESREEESTEEAPSARKVAPVTVEAPYKPSYAFLAVTSVVALALDLGAKAWAVDHLGGPHARRQAVIENAPHIFGYQPFFSLDLAQNKGGAWGIFGTQPDYVRLPFFFLISAVAVVFVVSLYKRLEARQVALKWALPLLLGGAAGNLIDRIRHQYVVDFLDVFVVKTSDNMPTHWPTFNVADVWIVVGVILMAVDMFKSRKPVPEKPSKKTEAEAEA